MSDKTLYFFGGCVEALDYDAGLRFLSVTAIISRTRDKWKHLRRLVGENQETLFEMHLADVLVTCRIDPTRPNDHVMWFWPAGMLNRQDAAVQGEFWEAVVSFAERVRATIVLELKDEDGSDVPELFYCIDGKRILTASQVAQVGIARALILRGREPEVVLDGLATVGSLRGFLELRPTLA